MRVVQDWIAATKQFTGFQFHIKVFGMFTLKQMNFGNLPFIVKNALPRESGHVELQQNNDRHVGHAGLGAAKYVVERIQRKDSGASVRKLTRGRSVPIPAGLYPTPQNKSWVEFCRSNIPPNIKMVVDFRSRLWYNNDT